LREGLASLPCGQKKKGGACGWGVKGAYAENVFYKELVTDLENPGCCSKERERKEISQDGEEIFLALSRANRKKGEMSKD